MASPVGFQFYPKCSLALVSVLIVFLGSECVSGSRHLGAFTVKDDTQDLLAMASEVNPVILKNVRGTTVVSDGQSPITSYALPPVSDTKAEESSYGSGVMGGTRQSDGGTNRHSRRRPAVLLLRPRHRNQQKQSGSEASDVAASSSSYSSSTVQQQQPQGSAASASAQYPQQSQSQYPQQGQPQTQADASQVSSQAAQSQLLQNQNEFTSIDQHQRDQQHLQHHALIGAGGVGYHTAVESVGVAEATVEAELNKDQKILSSTVGTGLDIYKNALKNPLQFLKKLFAVFSKFAVPEGHYLNVISFVGIYLFLSVIFYGSDDILQLTCDAGPQPHGQKEWHYHVGRRFVPGMSADPKLQLKFLELFRGMRFDDDDDSGSSSEEMSGEFAGMSDLCPRGAFFYSLSPMHLEARMQIQNLFVAQHSPHDVYQLAHDLLYKHKVHPKIWYLGLVGASLERPDMTGFRLAHPLDAIPDWFIPAEYIKDEMDKLRSSQSRRIRIKRSTLIEGSNSTLTMFNNSTSTSTTSTTTTTRRPTTRRILTRRPIIDSGSMESASREYIMDHGFKGERGDLAYDEDLINQSIRNYEYSQNYKLKNKSKNKDKPKPLPPTAIASLGQSSKKPKPISINVIDSIAERPIFDLPYGESKHKNHHKGKKGKGKGHKGHKGKGGDSDEDDECILVDGKIGRDNGIENKLWYFREDMMVNQHHWYWHLAHPLNATRHPDRRAELFFFTHRQFLARYNAERLSNGLHRTIEMRFGPGGIMLESYNSHLVDIASGKSWTPRHPKRHITDIRHEHNPDIIRNIMVRDVTGVYSRLLKGAKFGILQGKDGLLPIKSTKGIEPLANTVEATELSANPLVYDAFGFHNLGHILIAMVEDPEWHFKKTPGVMAEVATAMRDPIFYNYHHVIDDIFETHKSTLQPYKVVGGDFPLLWKGVEVHNVELISKGDGPLNQLRTFWTKKKFELAPSVDGSTDKEDNHANICAVHLAHEPFTFKITIDRRSCTKSKSGKGTIRIFMAPRYDEKGRRLALKDQRRLMFQLDAFQAKLRVGKNVITRRSHDSSLTKPWTRSLHDYEHGHDPSGAADFCGCGWPQHLFIPKGSPKGMPFDLFVMVTNYDDDHVENHPKDLEIPETCNSPYIMCGHPRRRYPDARPMGYPFDRPLFKAPIPCLPGYTFAAVACKSFNLVFYKSIHTLEEFTKKAPNMKSVVFNIKHIDKLVGHFYH